MLIRFHKCIILSIIIYALVSLGATASAYVRSSANYRLQSDSVNSGGTDESVSASYKAWDTIGEIGTGVGSSANYTMSAGYRQMEDYYLSMTVSPDLALLPSLQGLSGGIASSTGTWTVMTDCPCGYSLSIRATGSPALRSGVNSFADYTPGTANIPDLEWNIAAANSEFGYSPYNALSQAAKFKNDGGECNAGSSADQEKCWLNLGTTNETIANKQSRTSVAGEDTDITFRAEINSSGGAQVSGTYSAAVVVTAICN